MNYFENVNYNFKTSKYYVVISDGDIKGGAGISKLKGSNENICELQKMYFLEDIRGKGIGSKLIKMCLDFAKKSSNIPGSTCYNSEHKVCEET